MFTQSPYINIWETQDICNENGKDFKNSSTLHNYQDTPIESKNSPCNKKIIENLLASNSSKQHFSENIYKCDTGGRVFDQGSQLTTHQSTHFQDKLSNCKDCGKAFVADSTYNQHQSEIKGGISKPFTTVG